MLLSTFFDYKIFGSIERPFKQCKFSPNIVKHIIHQEALIEGAQLVFLQLNMLLSILDS